MSMQLYVLPEKARAKFVEVMPKLLDLNVELKHIDQSNEEDTTQLYKKFHVADPPQPILIDEDLILWESHTICTYLISRYGKNDTLYPKDFGKRALVDQNLYFNSRFITIVRQAMTSFNKNNEQSAAEFYIDKINKCYGYLEIILERSKWIASKESITIADYCIFTTIDISDAWLPINTSQFVYLYNWYKHLETLPVAADIKNRQKWYTDLIKNKQH